MGSSSGCLGAREGGVSPENHDDVINYAPGKVTSAGVGQGKPPGARVAAASLPDRKRSPREPAGRGFCGWGTADMPRGGPGVLGSAWSGGSTPETQF